MAKAKNKAEVCVCVLNWKKVGLALGLCWALAVFVLGLTPIVFKGWAISWVSLLATVYIGYGPTFLGAIIGAVWGFVDGFIGGAVFSVIYNWVDKKVK